MNRLENVEYADFIEDIVVELLDCGVRDLERLFEILSFAKEIGCWIRVRDIFDYIYFATEKENIDFNTLMYTTMQLIMDDLLNDLPDDVAEGIRDSWDPYINWFDSWFNNPIDELMVKENVTREKVLEELVKFYGLEDFVEDEDDVDSQRN